MTLRLLIIVLLAPTIDGTEVLSPCRFHSSRTSRTIDISSLGNRNGIPRYRSKDQNGDVIYYNGCHQFTTGACINVAACKETAKDHKFIALGYQNITTAQFSDVDDLSIHYSTGVGRNNRKFIVTLKCDPAVKVSTLTNTASTINVTTGRLTTSLVCSRDLKSSGDSKSDSKGLSAGSILLIIFFVGIALYLIIGILYNKFVVNAHGIEIIPNIDLWKGLIVNIMAGCAFAFSPCCGSSNTRGRPYEDI